jgi:hypothetical protein
MRVFIVVSTRAESQNDLQAQISNEGFAHYKIRTDTWLVAAEGTTREVAEKIGIRSGATGPGLVCRIESYSGRLPKDAWEWLALYEAKGE